jgi:hypothetical protein
MGYIFKIGRLAAETSEWMIIVFDDHKRGESR